MKFQICVAFIFLTFCYLVTSIPVGEDQIEEDLGQQAENDEGQFEVIPDAGENDNTGVRHRRLTCDVLSFQSKWITPNHSACAIHCIAQKKKGGKCVKGICVCRSK